MCLAIVIRPLIVARVLELDYSLLSLVIRCIYRERVHRVVGILWNGDNMTLVTHRVVQGGSSKMFDLLEIFQNIINIENYTPGTQQVQDHLMVDLVLRLLEQGIEHEIYCAMHGATWGGDPDPIFHNAEAQLRAGVDRPFHASIHNRPPPRPHHWVGPRQQQRMTQLLTRSAYTNRDMANQNQALRNLLRDLETPREMGLDWQENSFLDNIIQNLDPTAAPSSMTTIPLSTPSTPPPPFVPARPPTPVSPGGSRPTLHRHLDKAGRKIFLCPTDRRARERQRQQNATALFDPSLPPLLLTKLTPPKLLVEDDLVVKTTTIGTPRRPPEESLRPTDSYEGFGDAAGEFVERILRRY